MWNWIDDHENYQPILWGSSLAFIVLPFIFGLLFPRFAILIGLACMAMFFSLWAYHFDSPGQNDRKLAPHGPAPTGKHATLSRLRITVFGAVTTIAFLSVGSALFGGGLTNPKLILANCLVAFVGVPASLYSLRATNMMLTAWTTSSEALLDAATVLIALITRGDRRTAALQKLYDLENRFYVAISGYQSRCTFRSDPEWLNSEYATIGSLSR